MASKPNILMLQESRQANASRATGSLGSRRSACNNSPVGTRTFLLEEGPMIVPTLYKTFLFTVGGEF